MKLETISRRKSLALVGTAVVGALTSPGAVLASPLHLTVKAKERSNDIRAKIYVSVHMAPANINNHYLGTYYVPKNGSKKKVKRNIAGLAQAEFTMQYKAARKEFKTALQMIVAQQKRQTTVIKKLTS